MMDVKHPLYVVSNDVFYCAFHWPCALSSAARYLPFYCDAECLAPHLGKFCVATNALFFDAAAILLELEMDKRLFRLKFRLSDAR